MCSRFSETLTLKIRLPIEEDTQCQHLAYISPIPMATSAPPPHAYTCSYMHSRAHICMCILTHVHTCIQHIHTNKNENKGHLVGLCEELWAEVCWAVISYLSWYHAIYKPRGTEAMPATWQQRQKVSIHGHALTLVSGMCSHTLEHWSTYSCSPLPSENINLLLRKWVTKQVYKKARVLQQFN